MCVQSESQKEADTVHQHHDVIGFMIYVPAETLAQPGWGGRGGPEGDEISKCIKAGDESLHAAFEFEPASMGENKKLKYCTTLMGRIGLYSAGVGGGGGGGGAVCNSGEK